MKHEITDILVAWILRFAQNDKREIVMLRRAKHLLLLLFILISLNCTAQLIHFTPTPKLLNAISSSEYFISSDTLKESGQLHTTINPSYNEDFEYFRVNGKINNELRQTLYRSLNHKRCHPFCNSDGNINLNSDITGIAGESITKSEFSLGANFYYFQLPFKNMYKSYPKKTTGFAIEATFVHSFSSFPNYIENHVDSTHVIPGQGYAHNGKLGYEYNNLNFYTAKNAGDHFVFEAGFGKHFFGDGYRSLFLSDAAYSYPYFKITTTIWKLKYVNLWANFKDIRSGYDGWFNATNKYGAFHFLSWNATKRLNLNFFEAVIWAGSGPNHTRGFEINYLNPIIFYRPVEFSLGSPDNMLLGVGSHYKIGTKHVLYTQIMLDEFLLQEVRRGLYHNLTGDTKYQYGSWFNKQAWQLGYKFFDVGGIQYLNFQSEFNYVRPYTYSHREPLENYGHFNEALAHPLGANFWESVSFLRYSHKKWYFETEYMHYLAGLDSAGTHYGQDIFKATYDTPENGNIVVKQYGNKVGQGVKTTVDFIGLKVSYLLINSLNLRLEAGYIYRSQKSSVYSATTNYLTFGIRTSLDNRYYDF